MFAAVKHKRDRVRGEVKKPARLGGLLGQSIPQRVFRREFFSVSVHCFPPILANCQTIAAQPMQGG